MDKPVCRCGAALVFRGWSKRRPAKSEALAECPQGCGMWQIRYYQGKPTSEPYQVRGKGQRKRAGSYRLAESRRAAIVAQWGSVQNFLDCAPVISLPCIARQYKT